MVVPFSQLLIVSQDMYNGLYSRRCLVFMCVQVVYNQLRVEIVYSLFIAIETADCSGVCTAIGVFYTVSSSATSLLFFLRARAVFFDRSKAIVSFFVLWLSLVAGAITVPFAIAGSEHHIGPTLVCFQASVRHYSSASIFTSLAFDTIVVMSISYRLIKLYVDYDNGGFSWIRTLFTGQGLSRLTKVLLVSGQQYYL
jgi:hypothetical protein